MSSKAETRTAIETLLAEMRDRAQTVEDIRDTVEISCIVREMALPVLNDTIPPSLVPALARATLLGAWVQYDARRAGQQDTAA